MRNPLTLIFFLSLFVLPGCRCCRVTELYVDQIDKVADRCGCRHPIDNLYCEKLDVSRWCMYPSCPPSNCPRCNPR